MSLSGNSMGRPGMQSGMQSSGHAPLGSPAKAVPAPAPVAGEEDLSSIGLVEEEAGAEQKTIQVVGRSLNSSVRKDGWKRDTLRTGTGAVRMRSFHGRLSAQGLEYLDNQVNEWLDAHPEVEVKFVTSTVGTFEGKMREPALILNIWY